MLRSSSSKPLTSLPLTWALCFSGSREDGTAVRSTTGAVVLTKAISKIATSTAICAGGVGRDTPHSGVATLPDELRSCNAISDSPAGESPGRLAYRRPSSAVIRPGSSDQSAIRGRRRKPPPAEEDWCDLGRTLTRCELGRALTRTGLLPAESDSTATLSGQPADDRRCWTLIVARLLVPSAGPESEVRR